MILTDENLERLRTKSFQTTRPPLASPTAHFKQRISHLLSLNRQQLQASERAVLATERWPIWSQHEGSQGPPQKHKETQKVKGKSKSTVSYDKNEGVPEMDRIGFEKKYKDHLRHKYNPPQSVVSTEIKLSKMTQEEEQPLDEEQFQAMFVRSCPSVLVEKLGELYEIRKNKQKVAAVLKHTQKYMYEFRMEEFVNLDKEEGLLPKQAFQDYLFKFSNLMILFNIDPETLTQELIEFNTANIGLCSFEEFSSFLVVPRDVVPVQKYSSQNLQYYKVQGPALRKGPLKAKLLDEERMLSLIKRTFDQCDMFGNNRVQKGIFAIKLKQNCLKEKVYQEFIFRVLNNDKLIPLSAFIFQLTYELAREFWSWEELLSTLTNYRGLKLESKEKIVQKEIMAGKFDSSYISLLPVTSLSILKAIFDSCEKSGQRFVKLQSFLENVISSPKYASLRGQLVRREAFRNLGVQTIQEALDRMRREAQSYVDFGEVVDFLSNRGRPSYIQFRIVEEQKKAKQGEEYFSSDDQQHDQHVEQKKKKKIMRAGKNLTEEDEYSRKKVNVTVPQTFQFQNRKKSQSIRQRKLKEELQLKHLNQKGKPFKASPVPDYVSGNYYQTMLKEQEIKRRERKAKFKQEAAKVKPVSASLTQRKPITQHCPVERQNYMFRARNMPWYCQVELLKKNQQLDKERFEKIYAQVKEKHLSMGGSSVGQKMQNRIDELKTKWADQRLKRDQYRPSSLPSPEKKRAHSVPNFKAIHERLKKQLQAKMIKGQRKSVVKAYSLSQSRGKKPREKKEFQPRRQRHRGSPVRLPQVRSTLKHQALVELRRSQRQVQQVQHEKTYEQQKYLKDKRKQFARNILGNLPLQVNRQVIIKDLVRRKQHQQRELERKAQLDKKDMYMRLNERPPMSFK